MSTETDNTTIAHCYSCNQDTNHIVLGSNTHTENLGDYKFPNWATETYELLKCLGCESVIVRRQFTMDALLDIDDYGNPCQVYETTYFPPAMPRLFPKWLGELNHGISALMEEIYAALGTSSLRLASMGARAVLDMVMVDHVGDCGCFAKKLVALKKRGIVSDADIETLQAVLNVGSASAHRGHAPSIDQFNTLMDILESTLHRLYIVPKTIDKLKKSTPPRHKA